MRAKVLWAALVAPPLVLAALVYGGRLSRCPCPDACDAAADTCDASGCCPPAGASDAPEPASSDGARPVDPERQIVLAVEGLTCPAVKGIGCGHMLRPVLASLDTVSGVTASAANYTGTMLRISA